MSRAAGESTEGKPLGSGRSVLRALVGAWLATACSDGPSPPPDGAADELREAVRGANLLLISFDTTRADRIGCYGHGPARTGCFDRLAAEGVLFENAYCAAPVTLPSHTTMLTGLDPIEHGVRDNGLFRAADGLWTLPEALKERGYQTASFVSCQMLHSDYGLDQGFDRFDDHFGASPGGAELRLERGAEGTTDAFLGWLGAEAREPWFALVHYYDPHAPYTPPPRYARAMASLYDAEIAFADRQMSRILEVLDAQGQADRTLVCATADHGEGLFEHDEPTHGLHVYDTTMRVPLVFRHPALGGGRRIDAVVSHVDLFPTFLDLLGREPAEGELPGDSLVSVLAGDPDPVRRDAYLEALLGHYSIGLRAQEGIVSGGWKYVDSVQPELYDLGADPGELRNLWSADDPRVIELRDRMVARRGGREPGPPDPLTRLSQSERAALESLGYRREEGAPRAEGLDPKEYAKFQGRRAEVQSKILQGDHAAAEPLLLQIIERFPGDAQSLAQLGHVQLGLNRIDEARQTLQEAITRRHDLAGAWFDLARVHRRQQDPQKALDCLANTVRHSPRYQAAYQLAIDLCETMGWIERLEEWRRRLREVKG